MRSGMPNNRVSAYYRESPEAFASLRDGGRRPEARPRRRIALVHRVGGPVAGVVACLLQLAASTLCVAGVVSTWLGHPIGLSQPTAVLLGGAVFGASSVLLLYSFLVGAAIASVDAGFRSRDDRGLV